MSSLSKQQLVQEEQYKFPYHHIPILNEGNFKHFVFMRWGYEYLSYINEVISYLKNSGAKSVIDIGCGDGRFIKELIQACPEIKEVLGIDYSETAIILAKVLNPIGSYKQIDLYSDTTINSSYSHATLIEVLEHIPQESIDLFLKRIADTLKPQGKLIITVPSTNTPLNPKHYQHFDEEKLKGYLSPFYTIEKIEYINSISIWTRIIETVMTNKFFILKQRHLLNFLYKFYLKHCFHSNPAKGKRLMVICRKL